MAAAAERDTATLLSAPAPAPTGMQREWYDGECYTWSDCADDVEVRIPQGIIPTGEEREILRQISIDYGREHDELRVDVGDEVVLHLRLHARVKPADCFRKIEPDGALFINLEKQDAVPWPVLGKPTTRAPVKEATSYHPPVKSADDTLNSALGSYDATLLAMANPNQTHPTATQRRVDNPGGTTGHGVAASDPRMGPGPARPRHKSSWWCCCMGTAEDVEVELIDIDVLILAAQRGDLASVLSLLAKGYDVLAFDERGATALMAASYFGHVPVIKALVAKGADVQAGQPSHGKGVWVGTTSLMFAAQNGHLPAVEALLDAGADVNAASEDGMTSLMRAASHCQLQVVEALLRRGADPRAVDADGETAVDMALPTEEADIEDYEAVEKVLKQALARQ